MKAIKSLLAVSILAAATGAAHATTVAASFGGNSQTKLDLNGSVLQNGVYTDPSSGSTVQVTGGVFSGGTFTFSDEITSPASSTTHAIVTGTMQFLDGSGTSFVNTFTGCTDLGAAGAVCSTVNPMLNQAVVTTTSAHDFSNLATMTWSTSGQQAIAALGGLTATTISNWHASASAPAVPVPAAAWLFGSGLLGLAGTARRRSK